MLMLMMGTRIRQRVESYLFALIIDVNRNFLIRWTHAPFFSPAAWAALSTVAAAAVAKVPPASWNYYYFCCPRSKWSLWLFRDGGDKKKKQKMISMWNAWRQVEKRQVDAPTNQLLASKVQQEITHGFHLFVFLGYCSSCCCCCCYWVADKNADLRDPFLSSDISQWF